jgi:hypothetical protein
MDRLSTLPPAPLHDPARAAARTPLLRVVSLAALAGWSAVLLVAGAYLLAAHIAPLPQPSRDALAADVAQQRRPDEVGQWLALHALFADCGCSRRVAAHLLSRHPQSGIKERVLLVGDSPYASDLRAAGYPVDQLDESTLRDRYGFEGVPAFALVDPQGRVRYLGGYTRTKQGESFVDVAATRAALRGETVDPLPILGCAVGRSLQERRDPLGLL